MKKQQVEIEIGLNEYFVLNEAARKRNMLLDNFIEGILRKELEKAKGKKLEVSK